MAKDTITVKDLAQRVAKAKDISNADAAKLVRSRIRSQTKVITPSWPQLSKIGKATGDGNRYPDMPKRVGDALFANLTKGTALKDTLAKAPRVRKAPKTDTAPKVAVQELQNL